MYEGLCLQKSSTVCLWPANLPGLILKMCQQGTTLDNNFAKSFEVEFECADSEYSEQGRMHFVVIFEVFAFLSERSQ